MALTEVGYCWSDLSRVRLDIELVGMDTDECNSAEEIDIVCRPPLRGSTICYSLHGTESPMVNDEAIDT